MWIALACLLTAGACSELDRATDCSDICKRYRDCVRNDYNVARCEDRCNDLESDRELSEIDRCEDCLDDRSCTGAAFSCAEECISIVP